MLRTIIIDDEQIGINTLKLLMAEHTPGIKVVATAADPEQGIELIEDYRPDVVFLDISMPTMNGFELVEQLKYRDFKLVFTTAHNQYAIKAIKNKAQDYLLKPIDVDELKACVAAIVRDLYKEKPVQQTNAHIIELAVKNGVIFLRPMDIIRLKAEGSYTTIYLVNQGKELVSKNLKECAALLAPSYFYRCHHSHLINLHRAVRLVSNEGLYVQMEDGTLVEISRKNKEELLEKLKQL